MNNKKYTCPCCGYKSFEGVPGSYEICDICFWEDDATQLRNLASGGANINLIEAQKNYQKFGACEEKAAEYVRKPTKEGEKDTKWRLIDIEKDKLRIQPQEKGSTYLDLVVSADNESIEDLYYWS